MRWLLSIWRIRREPPSLRELPGLYLKVAVWGVLIGLLSTAVFAGPVVLLTARGVILSALAGIVFAACFYTACNLGNAWLRTRVVGYPQAISTSVFLVFNAAATSFAFAISVAIIERFRFIGANIRFPYFWQAVAIDAVLGAVLSLVIGAFAKLKLQVENTQAELREKELLRGRLEAEAARAQALALQAQINPHFFFNTLNTIAALIDLDPEEAKRTIGRLADMFRYALNCTQSGPMALDQEVQFVRDYLAVEQARFRRRLRVELPDTPLPGIRVPGLVLQPLVENAVKYGIAPSIDGGTVSVLVSRNGEMARVAVRNTAEPNTDLTGENLYRHGHALDNVRARLRLFTGDPEPLVVRRDGEWIEFSFDLVVDP